MNTVIVTMEGWAQWPATGSTAATEQCWQWLNANSPAKRPAPDVQNQPPPKLAMTKRNLETVQGVLEQLRISLTLIVNAMRKWFPTANPLPPSSESGPRNYTDDQIIEMRRHMDDHVHDQEDYGASTSVWI